jgi:Fur family zinc uptake transcriptional regulator
LLICKQCQNVEERAADSVMDALKQELQQAGFISHHQAIEIQGLCVNCRELSA